MRITGGNFKGKKLNTVNNPAVRPTKAMVREALFSILGPGYCQGKVVLDLYSGSGILALEALSRGALEVVCVDSDINSCKLIRSNLISLNIPHSATLLHMSASQSVPHLSSLGKIFDLIFLDPPYATPEVGVKIIDEICWAGISGQGAIAVLEHKPKVKLLQSQTMHIWKQKKYGHSMLTFYSQEL
jgi:16S rRNA (guanine966-N2)-methyltransferase